MKKYECPHCGFVKVLAGRELRKFRKRLSGFTCSKCGEKVSPSDLAKKRGKGPKHSGERKKRVKKEVIEETPIIVASQSDVEQFKWRTGGPPPPGEPRRYRGRAGWRPRSPQPMERTLEEAVISSLNISVSAPIPAPDLEVDETETEKLDNIGENLGETVYKRKSAFERTSDRIEQYLSGIDKAQTAKEIAEGLEMTTSSVYTTLQLMEVFGTVQKAKRRGYYYFLKGVYDDEQISAMLPPEKVKPEPRRRRSLLRSPRRSDIPVQKSLLEEHLSAMRVRASSGEGPSALAMIGLNQIDVVEVVVPAAELILRRLDVDIEVEERKFETPIKSEPFGTVKYLPKDVRRLTLGQKKYLGEQLKELDGYDRIERFTTAFAEFPALESGRYGSTLYFSMGTNLWDTVQKVTIDPSISDLMVLPTVELKRWSSWNDFLMGLKETRTVYGKDQYDRIIDQFTEFDQKLVEITVENRKANYVSNILNKRIVERGLEKQVKASHVKEWVYLEKVIQEVKR